MSEQGEAVKLEQRHFDALELAIKQYRPLQVEHIVLTELHAILRNQQAQIVALTAKLGVGAVPDDYREIARLIGSIFFYGNFKAETFNEQKLEQLLRKVGFFFESDEQVITEEQTAPQPAEVAGDQNADSRWLALQDQLAYTIAMYPRANTRDLAKGIIENLKRLTDLRWPDITTAPKAPEAVPLSDLSNEP